VRLHGRTLALALAPLLLLAACASTPQASVLRFHNQPISRGTVYLKPANPMMAGSLEFQAQARPVAAELQRQGFTVVSDPAQAQFLAVVDVSTAERMGSPRQSNVSIGVGGGFSSGNVGIGGSMRVPVGGQGQPNVATTTTLKVSLTTPTNQAVWEGRATIDSPAGSSQTGTVATPALAGALFRDFPGPSGQTVRVPLS
jgi:hypothetical protein